LGPGDLERLAGISLFAALSEHTVRRIGLVARRVEVAADRVVFEEGTPAKEMTVVLDGRLEVVKRGRNGNDARLALLGPGAVVGEMSLVDIQPRSAAVRTLAPSVLVMFSHGDIASVYREDPQSYTLLVLNIAREILIRLRRMDGMLANLITEIGEVTDTPQRR